MADLASITTQTCPVWLLLSGNHNENISFFPSACVHPVSPDLAQVPPEYHDLQAVFNK